MKYQTLMLDQSERLARAGEAIEINVFTMLHTQLETWAKSSTEPGGGATAVLRTMMSLNAAPDLLFALTGPPRLFLY